MAAPATWTTTRVPTRTPARHRPTAPADPSPGSRPPVVRLSVARPLALTTVRRGAFEPAPHLLDSHAVLTVEALDGRSATTTRHHELELPMLDPERGFTPEPLTPPAPATREQPPASPVRARRPSAARFRSSSPRCWPPPWHRAGQPPLWQGPLALGSTVAPTSCAGRRHGRIGVDGHASAPVLTDVVASVRDSVVTITSEGYLVARSLGASRRAASVPASC